MILRSAICVIAFVMGAANARPDEAGSFTAKPVEQEPPKELKDPVRALLGNDAVQVADGKGGVLATFWFRKEIPAQATPDQVKNGLTYREIAPTTVVAAVQFPQTWSDFRKQEIPAGVYTLRMAIQPQDGDHMGTAPYNEFVLLSQADMDVKADTMEVKALHKLSGNSTGGTHPAVLLLFPNPKPDDAPKVTSKTNGIWVLTVKRPIVAGTEKTTLGFGLTVVGHTTE